MRIIAGAWRGRLLKSTTGPGLRPAMGKVREALFSMIEARDGLGPETRVLDLFAGGGSLGFEAMSRGAGHVDFIENASYAVKIIRANAEALGLEADRCTVRQEDVLKALRKPAYAPYSLVFIDPPYQLSVLDTVLKALYENRYLAPNALINAEVEAHQPFDPSRVPSGLVPEADRAYGQTRVLLWTVNPT